jgi:hypothetical protein
MEINPIPGEEAKKVISELYTVSPVTVAKLNDLLFGSEKK